MAVGADGSLKDSKTYKAWVHSQAKLAYNSVAAWLEKKGDVPEEVAAVQGLAENLQLQDRVAQSMKRLQHLHSTKYR
jgi:exoribonuclease II